MRGDDEIFFCLVWHFSHYLSMYHCSTMDQLPWFYMILLQNTYLRCT